MFGGSLTSDNPLWLIYEFSELARLHQAVQHLDRDKVACLRESCVWFCIRHTPQDNTKSLPFESQQQVLITAYQWPITAISLISWVVFLSPSPTIFSHCNHIALKLHLNCIARAIKVKCNWFQCFACLLVQTTVDNY